MSYHSTPKASGMVGWNINKDSDEGTPHGFTWQVDDEDLWDTGVDFENVELVLAFDYSAPGDVIRVGLDGKIIMGRGVGSPSTYDATLTLRTHQGYGLWIEPIEGAGEIIGGVRVTQKGNAFALDLRQENAGNRRTTIALGGDSIGFRIITDETQNNTNDFGIYDNAASAYRLRIHDGGEVGVNFLRSLNNAGPCIQLTPEVIQFRSSADALKMQFFDNGELGLTYLRSLNNEGAYLQFTSAAIQVRSSGSANLLQFDDNGLAWVAASLIQTTVGAAGSAAALPGTPAKYLKVVADGVTYVLPAYAAA